jgi:hypothetical protein
MTPLPDDTALTAAPDDAAPDDTALTAAPDEAAPDDTTLTAAPDDTPSARFGGEALITAIVADVAPADATPGDWSSNN